ncbi:MAG TPA: hypothetical protein VJL88_07430 [Nitrospira sp.]|nr:hypothetical protein [Nitrospira sp.]
MRDPQLVAITVATLVYCLALVAMEARSERLVSPLALIASLSIIHFCVPGFLAGFDTEYSFINPENEIYRTEAMLFVFSTLVALHIGVWGVAREAPRLFAKKAAGMCREWRSVNVLLVTGLLALVGWVTRAHVIASHAYFQFARAVQGELEGPWYAAIRMAELLPMHALFILVIHATGSRQADSKGWRTMVRLATLLELAYWLPTGRKEETILIILIPILIRYLRTGLIPSWRSMTVFVAFVAALFPLAFYYRFVLQKVVLVSDDIWQAVPIALAALDAGAAEDAEETVGQILLQRMDLLESVSASIALIDRGQWPLDLGGSYALALLSMAPRVFWPSKPDFHYGTEFGHASGIITNSNDWFTSISVTFAGEAFLNFSWLGCLVFVMLGGVYGLLYEWARRSRLPQTGALLYAITLPTILFLGGTFALHIGGLMKFLPFYLAVGWLMVQPFPPLASGSGSMPPAVAADRT